MLSGFFIKRERNDLCAGFSTADLDIKNIAWLSLTSFDIAECDRRTESRRSRAAGHASQRLFILGNRISASRYAAVDHLEPDEPAFDAKIGRASCRERV